MSQKQEKKTAVALEYEPGDQAPKVIATGQGLLAEKIIDVAKEVNVPIHKDEKFSFFSSEPYRCTDIFHSAIFCSDLLCIG